MNQDRHKRKMSAIFSADVVGYSRLMEEDESWAIKNIEENKSLISNLIDEYHGRVVDDPGDNVLAEFSSVTNALECAVKIQEELKKKNANMVENSRMEFRIGINLGEIVEEGGRIYGSGVNIAARIEGLSKSGGICISGRTYDHIKSKFDFGYEYLGEHEVKNISEPIRVYRVLLEPESNRKVIVESSSDKISYRMSIFIIFIIVVAGLSGWFIYSNQSQKTESASIKPEQKTVVPDVKETTKTIAVLPFVNRSSEKEQEYFIDGLSEEIITRLSQISGLHVTSSTSSFAFKGTDKTAKEIAEILEREYILEGSVRKSGNDLIITAKLIRTADDSHLWSETYDRELKDIFEIQEDIATKVAEKLKLTLEAFQLLGGTKNLEAYEQYLVAKGLYFTNDVPHALEAIGRAIALDPEFALAWAHKAIIHWEALIFAPANIAHSERDAGLKAALRSIGLEPDLGEAYLSLGASKMVRGEFMEAELAYHKGMELTTESKNPWEYGICIHYNSVGHFKRAHEIIEGARRNDPLNKLSRAVYMSTLGLLGNIKGAEEEYERGKALFSNDWFWGDRWIIWLRLGAKNVVSIDEIPASDMVHEVAKKYLESSEDGLAELQRLYISEKNLHSGNFACIAEWAAYFNDPEFALNAMKRSVALNASALSLIWHPLMKDVRQLPLFKEFMREIGLVDYWKEYGWPDLCHPIGDDDFVCD